MTDENRMDKEINDNRRPNKNNGLRGLGYVFNLPSKERKDDCISILNNILGKGKQPITLQDIDDYIKSDDCQLQFLDKNNQPTDEATADILRFQLPYKDNYNGTIYGEFSKKDENRGLSGVIWQQTSIAVLLKYGHVHIGQSISHIQMLTGNKNVSKANIGEYIIGKEELLNRAGYPQKDGTKTTLESAKFIRFKTTLKDRNGEELYIWFTRSKNNDFEGITCGNERDFKQAIQYRFNKGRLSFESKEKCIDFLKEIADAALEEPWDFKMPKENGIKYPILASYIEQELNRLFYEQERLHRANKIIFNKDKTRILFNTNLLDRYVKDILIVGEVFTLKSQTSIKDPKIITGSKRELEKNGFDTDTEAVPPEFFADINEIIFHSEWDVDTDDMDKNDHIFIDNIERFPDAYQNKAPRELSQLLGLAIDLAKRIAQRNYKFIVPMYYPTRNQLQLLMPIYLDGKINRQPDFALVLTPNPKEGEAQKGYYTPETILGLEEVYQDARLVAKPDETWLNPKMIE